MCRLPGGGTAGSWEDSQVCSGCQLGSGVTSEIVLWRARLTLT